MTRVGLLSASVCLLLSSGIALACWHEEGESVREIASHEIKEMLDGNLSTATFVEVTIEPGKSGSAHRHPGPGLVYVLEGQYELGIDDQETKLYNAGQSFYEPTGCLHRVSRNPSSTKKTRLIAIVLHPRNVDKIVLPAEPHN